MSVQLGWSYKGFEVVFLENDLLRVAVVPQIGAKIYQFVDKSINRDLLYHHPRVDLRPPVFGVNVDNWWTGGIDDVVPTSHPCTVGGKNYHPSESCGLSRGNSKCSTLRPSGSRRTVRSRRCACSGP